MCGISLEILILLKVINIEILKMLLFHWLEAKKILHEELTANTQPRRQQPPLLYNSPLEPLVASNCKGTNATLTIPKLRFEKENKLNFTNSKTNIQNNRDYSFNASINKSFEAPFNLMKSPLSAGLSFGGAFREYAGANPAIDSDTTRNDYTIRFSPSLTIPAGETMAVLLSGGFTRVDSNIPNSEYDNLSVTLGISKQF